VGPLDLRYDAGVYYILGTSLAEGRGYRLLNEPGAIQAIQYPPLLPLVVAAHQWLIGSRDPAVAGHALRWSFAGLFLIYGLAVYAFGRRWLRPGWAVLATLLPLLNLQLIWLSDALFAELPFACCAILFLLIAEHNDRRGLAALLGAAAYLFRTSGIALLVAWVLDALLQRRIFEAALRAGLAALPLLVWQAYVSEVQQRPDFSAPAYEYQRAPYHFYNVGYLANLAYVDPFAPERGWASSGQLLTRVVANTLALPAGLGESVSIRAEGPLGPVFRLGTHDPPWSPSLAISRAGFALIGLVTIAGLVLLVQGGIYLPSLYWAGSLALMVLTPWPSQFGRYLMPLAPISALGLVIVLANATRVANRLVQTATGAVVGILLTAQLLALGVVFTSRHEPVEPTLPGAPQRLFFYGPRWQQHDAALAWLAHTARPDAVVATSTPHRLHLASGLRAILPPFEPDANAAQRLLDAVPVEYLMIDDLDFLDVTRRYGEPVVAAHPERWKLVYGDPNTGTSVYRRTP
jgi:hypothetical protein